MSMTSGCCSPTIPENCDADHTEAMQESDQRGLIADQHTAIENEWQRWYNWADYEAAKCRQALRR